MHKETLKNHYDRETLANVIWEYQKILGEYCESLMSEILLMSFLKIHATLQTVL